MDEKLISGMFASVKRELARQGSAVQGLTNFANQVEGKMSALMAMGSRGAEDAEISRLEGRRIETRLTGSARFTATDEGQRGAPINIQISQDGPFIQTHYPLVLWRPSSPDAATLRGRWRPIASAHLNDQAVGNTAELLDVIDITYEIVDGGSQRNFQNQASLPLLSRLDCLMPLPIKTMWAPAALIQFYPTYSAIQFTSAVPPDEGELFVTIPGFRIVNM